MVFPHTSPFCSIPNFHRITFIPDGYKKLDESCAKATKLNIKPSHIHITSTECFIVFFGQMLHFFFPPVHPYSCILQPFSEQQCSSRRPPTNSWLLPSYLIIGEEMCKKIGHKTIRCKYFAPWSNQSDRLKVGACVEAALYQHPQSINYGLIIS